MPHWKRSLLISLACWLRVQGRDDPAAVEEPRVLQEGAVGNEVGAVQPNAKTRPDLSDVRIWANADFVDVDKYKREMTAVGSVGVSPMVRLELRDPMISTLIVPELEFQDLLRVSGGAAPKRPDGPMNETVLNYVESGRTLILTLSAAVGMNFPMRLANDVFGWNLKAAEIPSGNVLKEDDKGLAYAFTNGAVTLPCLDGAHAIERASLPPRARCVYGAHTPSDACAVGFVPIGKGAVVFIGYPGHAVAPTPEWDHVLELAAIMGRKLPQLLRGNATLSGTNTDKMGDAGLTVFGTPGHPLPTANCVKWRATLNCHPSGPRFPGGDRNCSEFIPAEESGFCECAGNQFTSAATCSHKAFTCENACGKVGEQFRTIYGEAYKPPEVADMIAQLGDADAAYQKARKLADVAAQKVSKSVTASRDIVSAYRKSLRGQPDAWETLDAAGRAQVEAGKVMKDMVEVARHTPSRGANVANENNRPWWIAPQPHPHDPFPEPVAAPPAMDPEEAAKILR